MKQLMDCLPEALELIKTPAEARPELLAAGKKLVEQQGEEMLRLCALFMENPEDNAKTVYEQLDLAEENIVEIPGVPFASVRGEVTTFSFAVSNASGAYSEYTGEDNYLIVRSIQGRVNKITDSRGTFTIYFDYAGPNISMPAF